MTFISYMEKLVHYGTSAETSTTDGVEKMHRYFISGVKLLFPRIRP